MPQEKLSLIDDFPPQERAHWQEALKRSLRAGEAPESLDSATEDGVPIRVLYTVAEALSRETLPARPAGGQPWEIRQRCQASEGETPADVIRDEIAGGATGVLLDLNRDDVDEGAAAALAEAVDPTRATIAFRGATVPAAMALLDAWRKADGDRSAVRASLGIDPLGRLAGTGRVDGSLDEALARATDLAGRVSRDFQDVRTMQVGSRPYHLAGSTTCQDVAFALATGLAYLRRMTEQGLPLADAAAEIEFSFQLDCRFFEAVAALRSVRLLWRQVLAEAGLTGTDLERAAARLHVQTGERVLTQRDPYVNLLRNTACVVAGALGGAEAITTLPHDAALGPPTPFARRAARNTQLVLQLESNLHRVADPLGGSWFLERLTHDLAEQAWRIVQQIEGAGGMAEALTGGLVHRLIEPARAARRQRLEQHEQVITGVTAYANAEEQPPPTATDPITAAADSRGEQSIEPLPASRLAEPFEWPASQPSEKGATP